MKPIMDDEHIDSSLYILNLGDTSTAPTNKMGEGTKNADIIRR